MSEQLGTVRNHGFDENGYERLEQVDTIVLCPACGSEVALAVGQLRAMMEVEE